MSYDAFPLVETPSVGFMPEASLCAARPVTLCATHQRTLRRSVMCEGVGVHSGEKVRLRLLPAPENTGIVFIRTDLKNGARVIPARWDHVVETQLCTVIGNAAGGRVATIEHLMAALAAYGLDNALIEIDGPEVPVMDGSAEAFVALLDDGGFKKQKATRRVIEILTPVEVTHNGKIARLSPSVEARYSFDIDFNRVAVGHQSHAVTLSPDDFRDEISRARTFGFYEEVDQLRKMGFARGGSLENAIVIKDDKILNADGLRYENEFVRHKILDAIGDLALAGLPIRGHFHGVCSGHALNNRLLHALFAQPTAFRIVEAESWA